MSFRYSVFLARVNESFGRWKRAEEIMSKSTAPASLESLKEVYTLRLKVFGSPSEEGASIIQEAKFGQWIKTQISNEDKYAAVYVQYMLAGVQGEIEMRLTIANKLKRLPVRKIYRSLLLLTD